MPQRSQMTRNALNVATDSKIVEILEQDVEMLRDSGKGY
jgi:hypothetical protein